VNWLCSLERIHVHNFIFHAVDEELNAKLLDMGLPSVFYESEQTKKYRETVGERYISSSLSPSLPFPFLFLFPLFLLILRMGD